MLSMHPGMHIESRVHAAVVSVHGEMITAHVWVQTPPGNVVVTPFESVTDVSQ